MAAIRQACLLEVLAGSGHAGTAIGFGLALAGQALASASSDGALLWVREAAAAVETGEAYGPGLARLGISPDRLILVEARTHIDALRAALEGARCTALSAVVLETLKAVDLTASRRLKLAAEKSGAAVVLIRLTDTLVPNSAQARWRVEAVPQVANVRAGSRTAFRIEVVKHFAGLTGRNCIVEWDHERQGFAEAISLPLASLSGIGSLAA